jgi:hypothetical protein
LLGNSSPPELDNGVTPLYLNKHIVNGDNLQNGRRKAKDDRKHGTVFTKS